MGRSVDRDGASDTASAGAGAGAAAGAAASFMIVVTWPVTSSKIIEPRSKSERLPPSTEYSSLIGRPMSLITPPLRSTARRSCRYRDHAASGEVKMPPFWKNA